MVGEIQVASQRGWGARRRGTCGAPRRLNNRNQIIGHRGDIVMRWAIRAPTAGAVVSQHSRKRGKALLQDTVGARAAFTSTNHATGLKHDRWATVPHADTHRAITDR